MAPRSKGGMQLDTYIGEYLNKDYGGRFNAKGDIGIEIEVEGRNLPPLGMLENKWWGVHADGSLRGGLEYTLVNPIKKADVNEVLTFLLDKEFKAPGVRVDHSPRTSVHIHHNRLGWRVQEIYTYACLYFIFENLLVRYAGNDRIGNMYCLGASDAEYLPMTLIQTLLNKTYLTGVGNEEIRYSGLNFASIFKFGSTEVRLLRGTVEKAIITDWIDVLECLNIWAQKINDPKELWGMYSGMSKKEFLKRIFAGQELFIEFCLELNNYESLMHNGSLYSFEIANVLQEWPSLDSKSVVRAKKKAEEVWKFDYDERVLYWRNTFGFSLAGANEVARYEQDNRTLLDYLDERNADNHTVDALVVRGEQRQRQNRRAPDRPAPLPHFMNIPEQNPPRWNLAPGAFNLREEDFIP